MYEKILVPLDGSKSAEVVLPYAEEIAGRLGSEIVLIYVNDPIAAPYDRMFEFYLQTVGDATKRAAERYIKKPGEKEIKVKSEILVGHPAQEIVDYSDKIDAGLIVMASHGRSGLTRWALGSMADKVLRITNRPVALIRVKGARPDVREKGMLNKILVPLDGSKAGESVIPYVEELASKLGAEVTVLQVLSPDRFIETIEQLERLESFRVSSKEYLEKVTTQLKQKGIAAKAEFKEVEMGTVEEEIIKLADESATDVVAMSSHGLSGVGRWSFGSVADRVLYEGNTPIMLVRALGASTA